VSAAVLLDSGPLGLLANPRLTPPTSAALQWLGQLIAVGRRVLVPALVDYEVRRELLRLNAVRSLQSLNALVGQLEFLVESPSDLRLAAEFWAKARQGGFPTASDPALDIDVIIAAQAVGLGVPAIVATGNVGHLSRFVAAELWQNVVP
jgi:predicted nucleic acid-binding protein